MSTVAANKSLKALDTRKSHYWFDTHIGPRHSKWLAENLEKMDGNYKRMLKLIEGDGDSFAKKAEMYYQRRPELLSHVEELYRMYKLLADRHEHLTLDLKKNLVPDLQTHLLFPTDNASEPTFMTPPHDPKMPYRKPALRAAGFDVFLGSGRSSVDRYARGDEAFSISDSETESDVSSLYSYPGISGTSAEEALQGRMFEPEVEHSDDGKLRLLQQDNDNRFLRTTSSGNFDIKVLDYEEELKMGNEKIRLLEEEIANLKMNLHNSASVVSNHEFLEEQNSTEMDRVDDESIMEPQESSDTMGVDVADPEQKILTLVEELRITKGRLRVLDKEVVQLRKEKKEFSENIQKMQNMLKVAQKDAASYKVKLETEKRQASKLQERIARYKASLRDRENEVRDLKEVISDANLKYQLHAEISRLDEEKNCLEEKIREWEVHCHSLETQHEVSEGKMKDEIEHLKADVEEKTNMLETLKLKYEGVVSKQEEMDAELRDRNDQIMELEKHLKQLVVENEGSCKVVEELRSRVEELREEVERQKVLIMEGAEGKREAIRQLCFSLDHYRDGYQQLRQAFMGHKHPQVFAS